MASRYAARAILHIVRYAICYNENPKWLQVIYVESDQPQNLMGLSHSSCLSTMICMYSVSWKSLENWSRNPANAVITCEVKLFQNYFSLRRRPSEIILFQRVETCLKLFQNYFKALLQLTNIFQHVHCRRNNFEIISVFYFTCKHRRWLAYMWNKTLNLFQNYFRGLLQLMDIFQYVRCRWNNFKLISELFQRLK